MDFEELLSASSQFYHWSKLVYNTGENAYRLYIKSSEKLARNIIKTSKLLSNMAARIMWSAMPYDMQRDNTVALQSLLPGAKEMLLLGTKACVKEASYAYDSEKKILEIKHALIQQNVELTLKLCQQLFSNKEAWSEGYGGQPWKKITDNLLHLYNAIKTVEKAKEESNWTKYVDELHNVVIYMNVLDGLSHNSGPLLGAMTDIELIEHNHPNYDYNYNYRQQLKQLMDAKELKEPAHVVKFVEPYLRKTPEKLYPFKDMLSVYRSSAPVPEIIPIDDQLQLIDIKKLTKNNIETIQEKSVKFKNSPEKFNSDDLHDIKIALIYITTALKSKEFKNEEIRSKLLNILHEIETLRHNIVQAVKLGTGILDKSKEFISKAKEIITDLESLFI